MARAMETPPLLPADIALGDPGPPKGEVDFGVTNSHRLWRAYAGDGYEDGAQKQRGLPASRTRTSYRPAVHRFSDNIRVVPTHGGVERHRAAHAKSLEST